MSQPESDRIEEAIRACVARCQFNYEPLTCIAEFVGELHDEKAWDSAELIHIQTAAARELARLRRRRE